jgi:hypothetical protein
MSSTICWISLILGGQGYFNDSRRRERGGREALAGWDEGNVFYSDQQLEDPESIAADVAWRHNALRKCMEFIRSLGDVKGPFS